MEADVADGVESAIRQERRPATRTSSWSAGWTPVGNCSALDLIDELQIDNMPILLGDGSRLFECWPTEPIQLERIETAPLAHG